MTFISYIPCPALQPYVASFAISGQADGAVYKILPGTGLVIGFQYRGSLAYLEDETTIPLDTAGITGLNDTYRVFKSSANIGSVLVFFRDGGAAPFFKDPLHELFKESISLDNFMLRSELLILEERLCTARTDGDKIKVVEQFLLSKMRQLKPDTLVAAAIGLIWQSRGNIRMAYLSERLHISQSPFEKRFRKVVGASPKKFASIVRLKTLIADAGSDLSYTEISYSAGFYDQSHFIKEFKSFTGETPEAFFGKEK
ncbi:AraC family transcriptional regulator [Mucilaginibacter mali]|uniref:AraC family transcriptional regulator n=1 Tax=Mucilaginibacter mali TaxID=2740462 RepID=A0A7D4UDN7_9SPHI|nr:helix-turn-helix domain-containing protein [Mucilaginibacter mali]QKJ32678.1 AraC family transcriptional regulator [Mucilaginibacter mali]